MAKGNKGPRVEKTAAQKAEAAATKVAQFLKVAKPRVARSIKSVSLLQNLSGSGYSYTESQAKQIVKALRKAVDDVEAKLLSKSKGKVSEFEFAAETEEKSEE